MTHYKDLKHDVKYIIYVNTQIVVGTFQYVDKYFGDLRKAVFLTERGYSVFVPFLELVSVIETSSLEAELL